jgi:hypothetical protein
MVDEAIREVIDGDDLRGLRATPFHLNGRRAGHEWWWRRRGLQAEQMLQNRTLVNNTEVVAKSGRRRTVVRLIRTHPTYSMAAEIDRGVTLWFLQ